MCWWSLLREEKLFLQVTHLNVLQTAKVNECTAKTRSMALHCSEMQEIVTKNFECGRNQHEPRIRLAFTLL